ncbi:putative apyrase 7 [Sesamum angolense]|uniref:Apyrase 7 n=1 Tax=Sesamum angolense TaxID=2727404 RepID=A0AAE1W247_9LAMI|nr:putative apyrase 7 [Sesamum angolense]
MVFGKFAELFSSAPTRSSGPRASSLSCKSTGLPPIPGSLHGYSFSSPEKKSNLRLSSSLQDLSTYRQLDLEEANISPGDERITSHALPPYLLQKENGVASFSKEKVSPGIPSRRKKWVRVVCVLLCLLMIVFLSFALQYLYSNWSRGPSRFYVVLDCGSTGTRVYVYQASINHKKYGNLPILLKSLPESFQRKSGSQSGRAYNRMETEPGFDKLVHNISGLNEAIQPLIQWAERQIPRKSHKTTSLFLYATAGVRRLPSSDSEWLLNNAWSILKSSRFLCKKEWVKIITGVEEAYYGWIALNYHTESLGSSPEKETYGALDLGGSSLQVTFEGEQAGYGLNDAFDKSVAHLLKRLPQVTDADLVGGRVEINHPCLQSGYKEQFMCSHCSSIHLQDGSSPTGGKEMAKGKKTGVPVQLIGVPNWAECSKLAKVAVNLSEWSDHTPGIDCELQPCALAENLPRPAGHFYAMSGFYVVYRFFNLTPDAALDDVLEKGREFCEKNWDVAKKSVVPQPFIEQYCFRAPYVVLLLREGLHITDSHVIIGSGSITWTLGVALFEAGKAFPYSGKFHSNDIFEVKINRFVLFAILFASLFMVLWDGRVKMPLSPTVAGIQQSPFDTGLGSGSGGIQFSESPFYSPSGGVSHSYSSGSLGQMQFDNNNLAFWTPNRSQMRLQSVTLVIASGSPERAHTEALAMVAASHSENYSNLMRKLRPFIVIKSRKGVVSLQFSAAIVRHEDTADGFI